MPTCNGTAAVPGCLARTADKLGEVVQPKFSQHIDGQLEPKNVKPNTSQKREQPPLVQPLCATTRQAATNASKRLRNREIRMSKSSTSREKQQGL